MALLSTHFEEGDGSNRRLSKLRFEEHQFNSSDRNIQEKENSVKKNFSVSHPPMARGAC
jgi:hypothetical protein